MGWDIAGFKLYAGMLKSTLWRLSEASTDIHKRANFIETFP